MDAYRQFQYRRAFMVICRTVIKYWRCPVVVWRNLVYQKYKYPRITEAVVTVTKCL